jgi:hypothetical protein
MTPQTANIAMHLYVHGGKTLEQMNRELPIGEKLMNEGLDELVKRNYISLQALNRDGKEAKVYILNDKYNEDIEQLLSLNKGYLL